MEDGTRRHTVEGWFQGTAVMKILIVDDSPKRYDQLVSRLADIGVPREWVDIVGSAQEARTRIEQTLYDLLILDVVLPLWPESEEDVQHSMDLLFEIHESELPNSPGHILGITADQAAAGDALLQFEEWTWTVVHYSEDTDEWLNRAINCARFILAKGNRPQNSSVDLAIICALAEPEQEEVLKLPWNWSSPRPIDDIVFVRDGGVEIEGRQFTVCTATAPRMGMVSTALLTASVIGHMRPRLVAMTGICAGVRGKVRLGDVLFADPAWDFQSGKRTRDKENTQFSMRPHQLAAPARVRSHVEQVRDDKAALSQVAVEYPDPDTPAAISRVFIGPVASGSAVLADGEVIKNIREQHQELIGVEMEIYGLFAAAHAAAAPQPYCFALKGVCDFADSEKEDGCQRYAAYASARVLQLLIERYGNRLIA